MNIDLSDQLRLPLEKLMNYSSRLNTFKPQKYWYPISLANYGVEEVISAVDSLCSFRTTMWEKTLEFERQFSLLHDSREAIMVNSGSSADLLIAFAITNPCSKLLSRGDEVLVPSVTWPTQIWSLMMAGLKVRLVDTNPSSLNVDLHDLECKIGPRTRAISLVHLLGNPCDMDRVMALCHKHDLILIEDCCEALGAKFDGKFVGLFGFAGSFSFFFSHHITTMEGGMILCSDEQTSDLIRLLRAHGWCRNTKYTQVQPDEHLDPRYMFANWGFNVRPTDLQAGFGIEQLKRLDVFQQKRVQNAQQFMEIIQRHSNFFKTLEVHPKAECSWFAMPIILTADCPFTKMAFTRYLEEQGIETRPIVAGNLAKQPVANIFPELGDYNLPGSDVIHSRGFYVGLHPNDSSKLLERMADVFDGFIRPYA